MDENSLLCTALTSLPQYSTRSSLLSAAALPMTTEKSSMRYVLTDMECCEAWLGPSRGTLGALYIVDKTQQNRPLHRIMDCPHLYQTFNWHISESSSKGSRLQTVANVKGLLNLDLNHGLLCFSLAIDVVGILDISSFPDLQRALKGAKKIPNDPAKQQAMRKWVSRIDAILKKIVQQIKEHIRVSKAAGRQIASPKDAVAIVAR